MKNGFVREVKVLTMREDSLPLGWNGKDAVSEPRQLADFWARLVTAAPWFDTMKECLVVVLLDSKLRPLGFNLVTLGLINQTLVAAREVYRAAIVAGAAHIIMAHNHPSGDPTPSADDIRATRDMVEAGKVIGIPLLDHVIIGQPSKVNRDGFVSLKSAGFIGG